MPRNVTANGSPLPYTGLALDRGRRTDAVWLTGALAGGRVLAFWRDRCLVADGRPVSVPGAGREVVFLGAGETAVFATDLSDVDVDVALRESGADAAVDVRALFPELAPREAAVLAYARGMLHWGRNQRFCGACGARTGAEEGGHVRRCAGCAKLHFPRIEPAVIVLVEAPDRRRCLLARHRGAAPGAYSTLAGFVEVGESLEDAVHRELAEEAGVVVGEVAYQASQAWPFPAGLMVGFRAVAATDEVSVDGDELVEARWFTPAEVRALGGGRRDSIEAFLVDGWLRDRG